MFSLLLLGNGWTDCVEIWNALGSPLVTRLCSSHGWGVSARAHVHSALLYLRNGSADCVQIWCVGLESLLKCFTQVIGGVLGGVSLHVRTCRDTPTPRFCISETSWSIVFKFGMWVGGHKLSAFHKSLVECICTCAPLSINVQLTVTR